MSSLYCPIRRHLYPMGAGEPIMKDKKWLIWGLIGFTVILLVTAIILFFQLKQPAPTPSPRPRPTASPQLPPIQVTTTEEVCSLSFTVAASPESSPSPSASPSPSPNPSPSASPSPSPSPQPNACFDTCGSDSDCESDLRCLTVSGTKRCVNPSCTEDADCICASPGPSASPSPSASPQAKASASPTAIAQAPAQLPQAGVSAPLVLGVSAGILLMLLGLVF